jgi:hypothetical protein
MNKSLLAVLNDAERLLVGRTGRAELAALDEDAAIELEARIRKRVTSTSAITAGPPAPPWPSMAGVARHGRRTRGRPCAGAGSSLIILPLLWCWADVADLDHIDRLAPDHKPAAADRRIHWQPPHLSRLLQSLLDDRMTARPRVRAHRRRIGRQPLQRLPDSDAQLTRGQALVCLPGGGGEIEQPGCQSLSGFRRIIVSG